MQRTAATPRANWGANCKVWFELAVVVLQSPPLPLTLTLGKTRIVQGCLQDEETSDYIAWNLYSGLSM
ncbi:MAG: hypothetical protein D6694_15505 [Gammaproteobacteria bacterium]|nr:MAG: hypothetical protein D6694_15505 [Gammaproteobacteria bacterium]